jgi:hypothetical protein
MQHSAMDSGGVQTERLTVQGEHEGGRVAAPFIQQQKTP